MAPPPRAPLTQEGRERWLRVRVGIFVIAALAAFIGVVYVLGARARLFEARYTIHADFTEVGGLREGATVRLAGVQIGRVTDVHLPPEPGGKVRVDLTIGRQFADRVRGDSVARIETQGLLGDRIVEIGVGTAAAPAVKPGEVLPSRDPSDIARMMGEGAETMKSVAALAETLRSTAETVNQSKVIQETAAAVGSARAMADRASRILDRVETGPGLAHALLYEEPVALRRVNELIARVDTVVARIERGEGALGVLTGAESGAAAQRLVAAADRLAQILARPEDQPGLLPALLFDPQYRSLLDDASAVARNLREVSERVARGRGLLGSAVRDVDDPSLPEAARDLQASLANLRAITARINEGEGTLGALVVDPTLYDRLAAVLDGASRSVLLRSFIRGLGRPGPAPTTGR
jgi:phospholipid/cholesterol/gamma-HCH transport system substrate-binding protein